MKARVPNQGMGGMNFQKLAKQAQEAQAQMEQITAQLDEKEYTSSSGGGEVTVTVSGKPELKKIDINPEIVDVNDLEFLSDMIVLATNNAISKANEEKESSLGSITNGLNIPGMF